MKAKELAEILLKNPDNEVFIINCYKMRLSIADVLSDGRNTGLYTW